MMMKDFGAGSMADELLSPQLPEFSRVNDFLRLLTGL